MQLSDAKTDRDGAYRPYGCGGTYQMFIFTSSNGFSLFAGVNQNAFKFEYRMSIGKTQVSSACNMQLSDAKTDRDGAYRPYGCGGTYQNDVHIYLLKRVQAFRRLTALRIRTHRNRMGLAVNR